MDLLSIYQPPRWLGEITSDLGDLKHALAHDETDLSPPYQRKSCWTVEQQERFMGHMLTGGEIMPIVIQRVPDCGKAEVLDGKQRLEAMLAFLDGRCGAVLPDGRRIMRADLPGRLSRVTFRMRYINLPFEERKDFYIRLNSAGSPHTPEDLEHARNAKENIR